MHHVWATHEEINDAIILFNPNAIRDMSTNVQAHQANNDFAYDDAILYQDNLRQAMTVWKSKDFATVSDQATRGFMLAVMFSIMTSKVGPHAPAEQARQMLFAQPEIAEFSSPSR